MVSARDTPYTVTNSFKRGLLMKTYARPLRRVLCPESRPDPALKKRRITSVPADENTASITSINNASNASKSSAGEHEHLQTPLVGDMGSENNLVCAIRESSAAILSSPSRHTSTAATVYSEEIPELDDDLSTPPSSPPPREHEGDQFRLKLALTPPPASTRKPSFRFLKRKRSANDTPLTELEVNGGSASMRSMDPPAKKKQTQPASGSTPTTSTSTSSPTTTTTTAAATTTTATTAPRPVLKQTTLDLGVASSTVRVECETCGMHYIPSSDLDHSLHRRYHDQNSAYASGVEFGKSFVRANASRWVYEASRFEEGYVVVVDRKSSAGSKKHAERVLEIANLDLGAVDIDDDVLWSKVEAKQGGEEADRFKFFLHMKGSRCVGLALAERIWEAHGITSDPSKLIPKRPSSLSCSLSLTKETYPVLVGISRIWTSRSSRRKGIALDLLDCVVNNYFYGMEMARTQVAFSQPTESGCALMKTFYGDNDWRIYTGSC
ncbi:sister chromatid cohesion acetyltransferase Eco1 [Trichophyton tonsurans CBS 112818]|uniref:Sister chromatid cohesion acetyltransferase Eco1 n=1 Tax=Trichophyton tonsurans (strain CBS 112818) TaxID=647933 RepID=F2SAE2_TRIT1|nr:sister chromatid cohesion acetyltransferase Eco1 [Trichophyton tonsurans CBS 112818]